MGAIQSHMPFLWYCIFFVKKISPCDSARNVESWDTSNYAVNVDTNNLEVVV